MTRLATCSACALRHTSLAGADAALREEGERRAPPLTVLAAKARHLINLPLTPHAPCTMGWTLAGQPEVLTKGQAVTPPSSTREAVTLLCAFTSSVPLLSHSQKRPFKARRLLSLLSIQPSRGTTVVSEQVTGILSSNYVPFCSNYRCQRQREGGRGNVRYFTAQQEQSR